LGYKLLLAPGLIWLLYVVILDVTGTVTQVTVFEAAMAPMITAGIIAIDHDLEPRLVTLMLGIGIPLSFVTLHLWHRFLTGHL
jgi:predicted permease